MFLSPSTGNKTHGKQETIPRYYRWRHQPAKSLHACGYQRPSPAFNYRPPSSAGIFVWPSSNKIPIDVVEHLLVFCADPNFQECAGLPLCLALRCGHPKEAVELLISHGADVNKVEKGGMYALYLAVKYHARNAELIQMLLDAGAELHPPGGRPDLEQSISYKREEVRLQLCELLGL